MWLVQQQEALHVHTRIIRTEPGTNTLPHRVQCNANTSGQLDKSSRYGDKQGHTGHGQLSSARLGCQRHNGQICDGIHLMHGHSVASALSIDTSIATKADSQHRVQGEAASNEHT
jgi:hypothetical protein